MGDRVVPGAESSGPERPAPGKPFPKGKSGNPGGQTKAAAEYKRVSGEVWRKIGTPERLERVIEATFQAAEEGDAACIKIVLDHTVGPVVETKNVTNVLNLMPAPESVARPNLEEWRAKARKFIDAKSEKK